MDDLEAELRDVDISGVQGRLEDGDLDETLGLSSPAGRAPAPSATLTSGSPSARPQTGAAASVQASSASWWGGIWTAASSAATAATNVVAGAAQKPEVARALDSARRALDSGSERLRGVAQKTADSVEKLLDVMDPLSLEGTLLGSVARFSLDDWARVKSDASKVRVVVCTLEPAVFAAVSVAFERLHGAESLYIRGIATDLHAHQSSLSMSSSSASSSASAVLHTTLSGTSLPSAGPFTVGLEQAVHVAFQRIAAVLELPDDQRPPEEFTIVAAEPFFAQMGGQTFFGIVCAIHDVKSDIATSGVSQLVSVDAAVMTSPTVATSFASFNWLSAQTDDQITIADLVDSGMRALLGSYWRFMRQANLVADRE